MTMKREIIELDPSVKPLEAMADWLWAEVRTSPEGVASLAHLLVVVPTAQSGRRLRLALARRAANGLLPPVIRLSASFARPADEASLASRAEELVALWEAAGSQGSLDAAVQLADIRHVLGANALTCADVAARVGSILTHDLADVEVERWRELAELEARYYAALAKRGRRDRILAAREAIAEPAREAIAEPAREEGVERVVLACLLDPLPMLETALANLALPVVELVPGRLDPARSPLRTGQIVAAGTAASESWRIAELFAAVRPEEALPALCLADASLYPELRSALQAKGLRLHDPSATPLASSSLGHLVAQIAALKRTSSYAVFSAFLRSGDARRWLCEELGYTDAQLTDALIELDRRQAQYLPERVEDIGPKTAGALRNICEFIAKEFRKRGVRELLQAIFRTRTLDERDADAREFAAAAEAVRELLDECFAPEVPAAIAVELFERRLQESSYELEPDEGEVILTDGWLEVPFLEADEVIVAGFQEGSVPESIVGHAFLPDSLRRGLGLPDNESRARRDRRILDLLLACRPAGAVRIFFHAIDAKGEVLKPSRLLFEGTDDATLIRRVERFYALRAGTAESPSPDFPARWRLDPPMPPEYRQLEFTSPSSLDQYLRCPFTYLLAKTYGERSDDRAEELDPAEFGTLVHEALEAWANGPLKDSEDSGEIARELAERIDALLQQRFGLEVPAIVALQGESAKRRLAHFARIQVERHREGWRIVASERKLAVTYGGTCVKGKCDRIDYHAATGKWCVIDYKTWDDADKAGWREAKTGAWKSLQLPLYCAMLDADADPAFAAARLDDITSAYCILGKTADDVCFSASMEGAEAREAEVKVRELIDAIEHGIFWPPSPKAEWQWDFKPWIFGSPAESVNPAWIADQEARLARREAEREVQS